MLNAPRFAIKVTHKPSGISAVRDSFHFRTERAAYTSALKYIKSRVYVLGAPPMKESELLIESVDAMESAERKSPEVIWIDCKTSLPSVAGTYKVLLFTGVERFVYWTGKTWVQNDTCKSDRQRGSRQLLKLIRKWQQSNVTLENTVEI